MNRTRFASALARVAMAAVLVPSLLTAQITFQRTYGGTDDDGGQSVVQTADGGCIVAGQTSVFQASNTDVYLIRTDSLGNVAIAEPKSTPTRTPTLSLSCEPNPCRGTTIVSLMPQALSISRSRSAFWPLASCF